MHHMHHIVMIQTNIENEDERNENEDDSTTCM